MGKLNFRKLGVAVIGGALLLSSFTGCARLYNSNEVAISDTNQYMTYKLGVVTYVKPVVLKDNGSGALIGGGTGVVLGSMMGRGKGNTLMTLLGGLGGALIGYYAGKGNGEEIGVRLEDGREVVLLVKTDHHFRPGEEVRIVQTPSGRIVRVEPVR